MEQQDLNPQRKRAVGMIKERFGIEFPKIEPGEVTAEWPLRVGDKNVHGIPYGGIQFTLADTAAGLALGTLSSSVITISSSCNFLYGSLEAERLICHARVRRAGNSIGFISAEVYDDRAQLLSTFEFVFGRKK